MAAVRFGDPGLFRALLREMGEQPEGNRLLVLAEHAQLPRVNFALLKAFLLERGAHGVYVTFEHPYRTMALELERAGLPFGDLVFLDAATAMTGEPLAGRPNVRFVRLPFDLVDALRSLGLVAGGPRLAADFVLVDGLHALFAYHTRQEAEAIIRDLLTTLGGAPNLLSAASLDPDLHRQVYEHVAPLCDIEVEVAGPERLRRMRARREALVAP